MDNGKLKLRNQGIVSIISKNDSFLAKSLHKKMGEMGIPAGLFHMSIKEIQEVKDKTELIILFMSEEMDEIREALVYIKDIADENDRKIILIGDRDEFEATAKVIPETLILELFMRPLNMDNLIQRVIKYLEENTGENRKKTVLIVDDDIAYMRMVYGWLKDEYHVGMSSNGVQAISYLARNKTDLVLLDYEMPIANGPQVLEMLKADSSTGQIPVMFLTGRGDKESVLSVMNLQPVDYLLKTIDKRTLLTKLADFFTRRP